MKSNLVLKSAMAFLGLIITQQIFAIDTVNKNSQLKVAFTDRCPVSDGHHESALVAGLAGALVVDIAGKLTASGIDTLAKYLSEDKILSMDGHTRLEGFFRKENDKVYFNPETSCLVLVVSKDFDSKKPLPKHSLLSDKSLTPDLSYKIADITGVRGPIEFYLEAIIQPSKNGSVFSFEPKYWDYPKFIQDGGWRLGSKRDILISVEISEPGNDSPFSTLILNWNNISSGEITNDMVVSEKLPWILIPQNVNEQSGKILKDGDFFPVNVKAKFVETAKPNVIAKKIGEALTAQKDSIVGAVQKSIKESISSEAKNETKKTAMDDLAEQYNKYVSAYNDAKSTYDQISTLIGVPKQQALGKLRIAYAKFESQKSTTKSMYKEAGLPFQEFDPLPDLNLAK